MLKRYDLEDCKIADSITNCEVLAVRLAVVDKSDSKRARLDTVTIHEVVR
jgi:hypothetical protein